MARQKIRFNYFKPQLIIEDNELVDWDMREFMETIINNKRLFDSSVILGDEISDLEWDGCQIDFRNDMFYIQLSKLRSKNIPSRKRVNQNKVDINLDNDEFIGEFNLLIFDPVTNVLITQGNFFGLTVKQISLALSGLRLATNNLLGKSDGDVPYVAHLAPILDPGSINRVLNNEIYRKITIKGADINQLSDADITSDILSTMINASVNTLGVNFEIQYSMGIGERNSSLQPEIVREMVTDVINLKEASYDVSMHIASKRDEENAIEHLDLFSPKLTSEIVLEVENRATIGSEYIYNQYLEQNFFNESKHIQRTLIELLN